MKTVGARDAKNRFGQLMDDAQRQPVTISKNGRPFAVIQSYADFEEAQRLKMEILRAGIAEARNALREEGPASFDDAAVEDIKAEGRRILERRETQR